MSSISIEHKEKVASTLVVIDDDDDDDRVKFPSDQTHDNNLSAGKQLLATFSKEKQAAVQMFMEIMGLKETDLAIREMERYDYDVQRAIDGFLRTSSKPIVARARDSTSTFQLVIPGVHSTKIPFSSNTFVDSDFPPDSSSLDGRKKKIAVLRETNDGSSSNNPVIRCHCGWVASAKTVQSDGPNYGRFYLACGKKALSARQQRSRVVDPLPPDATTNTTMTTASTATATTTGTIAMKNPYKKESKQLTNNDKMSPTQTVANKNNAAHCNFFQWDTVDCSLGSTCCGYNLKSWSGKFSWHWFGPGTTLPLDQTRRRHVTSAVSLAKETDDSDNCWFRPEHVRQGAVGNCWFLSALAVVAEHPYLLEQLLRSSPNTLTASSESESPSIPGQFQINLCLDGQWTPIVVDSYLPVVAMSEAKANSSAASNSQKRRRDGILISQNQGSTKRLVPAFCDVPNHGTMLWPALIEKAYAKAHGCYANLSGGFIAEAFADLTGAPTETIIFETGMTSIEAKDQLWARLLSFTDAGFLMGAATSQGGEGLVGGHAYSVLGVTEFHNCVVGEQQKVTDFFKTTTKCQVESFQAIDDEIHSNGKSHSGNGKSETRESIRLVRIRNPWGQKEWKGAWSADSEHWTRALRKQLSNSYSKGVGTFFMSFDDMLTRFHHMDVAKCRKGWVHLSANGCFRQTHDPMESSECLYMMESTRKTWAHISLVQPKKRANTKTSYWYSDASFMLLKKPKGSADPWSCEACILQGVARRCDCEVFFDPSYEYCCFPFAYLTETAKQFRMSVYSSSPVTIYSSDNRPSCDFVVNLHKELLKNDKKLTYVVASNALLVCVQGNGCLYFLAINGSISNHLSLRLTIDVKQGTKLAFGGSSDTHDVAPRSQKILNVLSRDGKMSAVTELSFQYISDVIPGRTRKSGDPVGEHSRELGTSAGIDITMAGDLLASGLDGTGSRHRGGDTIDIYRWIPQIGSAI